LNLAGWSIIALLGHLTFERSCGRALSLKNFVSCLSTRVQFLGGVCLALQVKAGGKKADVVSTGGDDENGDDDDWGLPAPGSAGTAKKKASGGNNKKKKGKGKK
jgi:hypothetical protein